MLAAGEQIPDVTVWMGPNNPVPLREVLEGRRALLLFYLFDWSAT